MSGQTLEQVRVKLVESGGENILFSAYAGMLTVLFAPFLVPYAAAAAMVALGVMVAADLAEQRT